MKLQEVKNQLLNYQEKAHELLQQTQQYYLNNKIQPYVWLDDQLRLRIKYKYPRTTQTYENNPEREKFHKITKQFAKENNLTIHYIHELGEIDKYLPEDHQIQWSTEFIIEV